jgi:hypothetical protein
MCTTPFTAFCKGPRSHLHGYSHYGGLENIQALLCTHASTHIPAIVLPPLSWYLQKSENEQTKKEGGSYGLNFLSCSMFQAFGNIAPSIS